MAPDDDDDDCPNYKTAVLTTIKFLHAKDEDKELLLYFFNWKSLPQWVLHVDFFPF